LKQSIFVINQWRSFNWDNRGSFLNKKKATTEIRRFICFLQVLNKFRYAQR